MEYRFSYTLTVLDNDNCRLLEVAPPGMADWPDDTTCYLQARKHASQVEQEIPSAQVLTIHVGVVKCPIELPATYQFNPLSNN